MHKVLRILDLIITFCVVILIYTTTKDTSTCPMTPLLLMVAMIKKSFKQILDPEWIADHSYN